MTRALGLALAVGVLASCNPGPAPEPAARPHPYFPIGAGVTHAIGNVASDGPIKCASCHPISNTNFSQFQCTGCHEHRQEAIDPSHGELDGYRYADFACYACHRDGTFIHAPYRPKDSRDPSRDLNVTALAPLFSGTTIVSVTPLDQSLPMVMNHDSDQIPSQAFQCSSCHPDVSLQVFFPGQFHTSLLVLNLPQPVACASCHAGTAPQGFVGALDPARHPASGQMRHDAVLWDGGVPTSTPAFSADCGVCHVTPAMTGGAYWSTHAVFHQALASHGQAQPSSCLDCHANTRPVGALVANDAGTTFNHAAWLGECRTCHASFQTWSGGVFHVPGQQTPASCEPCHEPERPSTGTTPSGPPFDYAGNALFTHGAGQDCAVCHASTSSFGAGSFGHAPGSLADNTCAACHTTQRPLDAGIPFGDGGFFFHAQSGMGDCIGCHQATTSHSMLSDWEGGQGYPGTNLISSTDLFVDAVTETTLKHKDPADAGSLVIGTSVVTTKLFNAMLHTSGQVPAGLDAGLDPSDYNDPCWHCHTSSNGVVSSFLGGQFHASLDTFRATPGATITPLSQPVTGCADCHRTMRPPGIVGVNELHPMDHFARFDAPVNVGGQMVSSVSQLDCSSCHGQPGASWDGGAFHTVVAAAAQETDCVSCHYLLMADAGVADVTHAAGDTMVHKSAQVPLQRCGTCHLTALTNTGTPSASSFGAATFHDWAQPSQCIDCHASAPQHPTQSTVAYQGDRQWMNHGAAPVKSRDCSACHLADASNTAGGFSASTHLHANVAVNACSVCHGPGNGGADAGAVNPDGGPTNNVPAGYLSAEQIDHGDLNVTTHDCKFCHTQVGPGSGGEWAQAKLHVNFTGGSALLINGTTGRCSHCHIASIPGATVTMPDHSTFQASTGTDCALCHSWPGATGPANPSWKLVPQTINVGGFVIDPALPGGGGLQAGVNNLSHPATPAGGSCTTCHSSPGGGRNAFGYDHALAPTGSCSACHEAGSDLVGTPWTLNAPGATSVAATCAKGSGSVADRGGDTRPIGITSGLCVTTKCDATCQSNHFFPADCGDCHGKPAAVPATVQTGAAYASAWAFKHYFGAPAQQTTCSFCH